MYDLWYALGYAISTPALLTTIDASAFVRLKSRTFTEVHADSSSYTIVNAKTAGLLDMNKTAAVRAALTGNLPKGHPPVSYYTAGKLCQFLAIGTIDSTANRGFKDIVALANGIYKTQVGANAASVAFLSLVGLSLIDLNATVLLGGATSAKDDLLKEFGVFGNAQETGWITNISNDGNFKAAQKSLLLGDNNTWDPNEGCSELIFTWDGGNAKSTRAVF